MTRDREHDAWIPWYVEDTAGWLELSLGARGAAAEIARKMGQRRKGELSLPRGLTALAVLLRVRWEDLEVALGELIATGRLTWDGSQLTDPDWESRQRSSSTTRMRRKRASEAPGPESVTRRHIPSHPVTERHAVSPSRSTSRSLSGSDLQDRSPVAEPDLPLQVGSATAELPPEADSEVRRRRKIGRDGECGMLFQAWSAGIAEATGKPHSGVPRHDEDHVVAIANTHTGSDTGQELLDRVQALAREFARSVDPAFGGLTAKRARVWFDDNRPTRASPAPRQLIGSAATAAWMNPKENFDFGAQK